MWDSFLLMERVRYNFHNLSVFVFQGIPKDLQPVLDRLSEYIFSAFFVIIKSPLDIPARATLDLIFNQQRRKVLTARALHARPNGALMTTE